jgi:hypothetical protein
VNNTYLSVSSADPSGIAEILLKVALNTITLTPNTMYFKGVIHTVSAGFFVFFFINIYLLCITILLLEKWFSDEFRIVAPSENILKMP